MGQSYGQLSEQERCAIFRLHAGGISRGEIARQLGRHRSTIGRELRRNALASGYQPVAAQRLARARRWRGTKIERSNRLRAIVDDQLIAMGRSPEQIAGRLEREQGKPAISHESIYRYIYSPLGRRQKLHRTLCRAKARRGRRPRKGERRPLIPFRVSIHDRPQSVTERRRFGHWEGDLMAFRSPARPLVVCVERKSRLLLARRQAGKTAKTTKHSLKRLLGRLAPKARRSLTIDNGGEFARHHQLGCKTYFCDPHSPWQKGAVENAIGRLRRDLPRSTDLSHYSQQDLDDLIALYNDTPRKCLGYRTPLETFALNSGVALEM
jgi:transposase, IS30 family